MKLTSLAPNARYDLVRGKPPVFERDNDGSSLYRFNIAPEMTLKEGETQETQTGWTCCEVRIWERPEKSVLKKAVIRFVVDESAEFALVNAYNKHVLKIKVNVTAVDKYKEYLTFTEEVDAMLETDFINQTD